VSEVLRQAIADAARPGEHQQAAREFLRDDARLALWVEVLGADVAQIGPVLRRAAGLEA